MSYRRALLFRWSRRDRLAALVVALAVTGLPSAAPPDGRPMLRVTTLAGEPMPNATVQARRRTLGVHRATGAGPARALRLVLRDALRLGAVSTAAGLLLGLAGAVAAAELGVLTVVGVRVPPVPSWPVLAAIATAALALTVASAAAATVVVLRTSPAALLGGTEPR